MADQTGSDDIIASLRSYLEELRDTGVDALPYAESIPAAVESGGECLLPSDSPETLDDILAELGQCGRCGLGAGRRNLVFGVGNPQARVVFVGEAPGRDEDLQGEPFVGEAGQLLTRLIARMGMTRQDVYICNVLKCRPPGNRNPEPAEIERCAPFMLRQVKAIAPEVVVALGTFAAHTLLSTREPISKLRGNFRDYHGIPLMATFHPSYLLHNRHNKDLFWLVWDDMEQVLRKLGLPVPEVKRGRGEG